VALAAFDAPSNRVNTDGDGDVIPLSHRCRLAEAASNVPMPAPRFSFSPPDCVIDSNVERLQLRSPL